MEMDLKILLLDILSVPTKTYQEDRMISFLKGWLDEKNFNYYLDDFNNIYVTKTTYDVDFYPCVVAHTDTVHEINTINIVEKFLPNEQRELKLSITSYDDYGNPSGIGGDDKCGVFACLKLLMDLPNLKVGFFVSEETGCHGSRNADEKFFENVGYIIQFDAPGNTMVSEYCNGVRLFERDSEFFKICDDVLSEMFNGHEFQYHPYTDVLALRKKFNISCINFAIGYYKYHTPDEYVVIEDVLNGVETGKKMIEGWGYKRY
jgi:di/tripeptidase